MTRKDELKQLAYTTVRAMIADGVKLSGGQYVVSEYAVFKALQQAEREVWSKINARMAMVVEDKDSLHEWVRAQQKELG